MIRWWESLPAGRQFALAYGVALVVLVAVHVAFFHRITVWRSLSYALVEAVVVAGLLVVATQSELARRRESGRDEDDGGATP